MDPRASGLDEPMLCVQVLCEPRRRGWARGFLEEGTLESFSRAGGATWIKVRGCCLSKSQLVRAVWVTAGHLS